MGAICGTTASAPRAESVELISTIKEENASPGAGMDRNPPQPGPSLCPLKQGREHRAVPMPGATPLGMEPTRVTGDAPPGPAGAAASTQHQIWGHATPKSHPVPQPLLAFSPPLAPSQPMGLPFWGLVVPGRAALPHTHTFEGTAGSGWVCRHPSSRSHPAADTPCPLSTKSGSPEGKTGSFPPSKGWGEAALHNRPYRLFPAGGMARLGSARPHRAPAFPPRSSEQGQSRRCIAPSRAGPPAAASSRPFPGPPGTSCSRHLEKRCPEAGQSRRFCHSRSDTPVGRPSPRRPARPRFPGPTWPPIRIGRAAERSSPAGAGLGLPGTAGRWHAGPAGRR